MYNHRVMRYLPGASSGTVVAGGNGLGLGSMQLYYPKGIYLESSTSSLIIVNYGSHKVVRWLLGASSRTCIIGSSSGVAGSSSILLSCPQGLTVDYMGNIYVADWLNHRVQFFRPGEVNGTTIAGTTSSSGATAQRLQYPYAVRLDAQLNLYVVDSQSYRVQKFVHF